MKATFINLLFCLGLLSLLTYCNSKKQGEQSTEETSEVTENKSVSVQAAADSVGLEVYAENLTAPVYLTEPADNSNRLFVVDQIGVIKIIKNGQLLEKPFLNLQSKIVELKKEHEERGLLGLAFHPDYKNNGRFFVYYSAPLREGAPKNWNHTSIISEYKVATNNADLADVNSERIIMQVDQPQANHNAGMLAFGPDGYLYISLGDGGGANDTDEGHEPDWYNKNKGGNGQHLKNNLLGSILRIDIDKATPYAIPEDNPFPNEQGMKEVYAYGLRNPYRFTFDMGGNHSLIAGDAGQELYEEINLIKKGGNYGWNVKEGTHCFNASNNKQPLNSCPDKDSNGNPLIDPVIEFKNSNNLPDGLGIVVVGGHVYRGKAYPGLNSKYLFGVWTQHHEKPDGAIFAAQANEGAANWNFKKLFMENAVNGELGHYLLGFGQDKQGEVYLLTSDEHGPVGNTGKVFRVR